ncbi:iron chaperone [Terrimonas alba]|uniref:iron chaperone n=1 Tax=Terrimonas alba TaxID=3349636 RepID=UPI0035F4007B
MATSTKASAKTKKAAKKKTPVAIKFKTVQEYIATLPAATKSIVRQLRQTIRQVSPTAEDMISYNMPAFKLDDKGLIWYAAWKEHISLYPRTRLMEAAIKELANYEGAKGTIKFPLTRPMPFDVIRKIVKFRMQEIKQSK